jgi:hypothetical protein
MMMTGWTKILVKSPKQQLHQWRRRQLRLLRQRQLRNLPLRRKAACSTTTGTHIGGLLVYMHSIHRIACALAK